MVMNSDYRQAKMRSLALDALAGKQLLGNFLPEELEVLIEQWGYPRYRAHQILHGYLAERRLEPRAITTLPQQLRERLASEFITMPLKLSTMHRSQDGTVKMLVRLLDDAHVEMVLIPCEMRSGRNRRTLCISTQAGCPLGCVFCATATLKLRRNLEAAEILGQLLLAEQTLGERITNVVFMGMGEPLLNYEAVTRAIRLMVWGKTPLIAPRHITLSTAGIVPAIDQLAQEPFAIKLAISLHATTDRVRTQLMPIARRWSIAELLDAVERYYRQTKREITYEYILFDQFNDRDADVRRLVRIARRVPSRVNVIPFHPIDFTHPVGFAAELRPARPERFRAFVESLRREGIPTFVRSSSGVDIAAACGQLALADVKTSR